jgi:hypothetical protein
MIVTMLLASATTGRAENCLDRAAVKIPRSSSVTVLRRDAAPVTGYLASVDTTGRSLTLFRTQDLGRAPTSYPLAEIRAIKFKKAKVRPALVAAGFVVGFLVAGEIAASSQSDRSVSQTDDFFEAYTEAYGIALEEAASDAVTMLLGGLVGAGVGAIVSTTIPETLTITCKAQP